MADDDGKAPTSTRTLWKGAISFGLVHVPVGLYAATQNSGIDFDWLDKRSMEPVGYKRINKITGKEMAPVTTGQIYWGAVPFVVIQLIMVAILIAYPKLVFSGIEGWAKRSEAAR